MTPCSLCLSPLLQSISLPGTHLPVKKCETLIDAFQCTVPHAYTTVYYFFTSLGVYLSLASPYFSLSNRAPTTEVYPDEGETRDPHLTASLFEQRKCTCHLSKTLNDVTSPAICYMEDGVDIQKHLLKVYMGGDTRKSFQEAAKDYVKEYYPKAGEIHYSLPSGLLLKESEFDARLSIAEEEDVNFPPDHTAKAAVFTRARDICGNAPSLKALVDEQESSSPLLIAGGSGTGKTIIVKERAKRLAKDQTTEVLVVNLPGGHLTEEFRREFKDDVNIKSLDGREMNVPESLPGLINFLQDKGKGKHVLIDEVPLTLGMQGPLDENSLIRYWRGISHLIQDPTRSLIVIFGPPSSGKSMALLERINQLVKRKPHNVSGILLLHMGSTLCQKYVLDCLGSHPLNVLDIERVKSLSPMEIITYEGLEKLQWKFQCSTIHIYVDDYCIQAKDTDEEIEEWTRALEELIKGKFTIILTVIFQTHSKGGKEISMDGLISFFKSRKEVQIISLPPPARSTSKELLSHICNNEARFPLRLGFKSLPTDSRPGALIYGPKPKFITMKYSCPGSHLEMECKGQKNCMPYIGAYICFLFVLEQGISGEPVHVLVSDTKLMKFLRKITKDRGKELLFFHPKDFRGCETSLSINVNVNDSWLLESLSRAKTDLFIIDCLPEHQQLWDAMKEEGKVEIQKAPEDFKLDEDTLADLDNCGSFLLHSRVNICDEHPKMNGCTKRNCQSLHICPKYLYDLCKDHFCEVGHDLSTDQNHRVLKKQTVQREDREELKKLLKPDAVVPDLCEDYNLAECKEGYRCLKMHTCAGFIMGTCNECDKNHNLLDAQCEMLLKKTDVNLRRTRKELKICLREKCGNLEAIMSRKELEEAKRKEYEEKERNKRAAEFGSYDKNSLEQCGPKPEVRREQSYKGSPVNTDEMLKSESCETITGLHKSGKSVAECVRLLGTTRSSVYKAVKRFKELVISIDYPRRGRPPTVNVPKVRKRMRQLLRRNPSRSMRSVASPLGISSESAQKIAKDRLKLKPYKVQKVQLLTLAQQQAKLRKAKVLLKRFGRKGWEKIIFTDEKIFTVAQHFNRQIYPFWLRNKHHPGRFRKHVQNLKSIMICVG
ncbi:unnamed protein product [Darwinula stevensoni]|uniref:Uncharacterized protein n=1 Tax=Darwinula stevensoni TaxID=69355 RepID=A0A7R8XIU5_9CRUS|nr:unnamed protein product [Darwinula stevensoni]CAG0894188.1 unnamed protein product [Darwinula stevensoni]